MVRRILVMTASAALCLAASGCKSTGTKEIEEASVTPPPPEFQEAEIDKDQKHAIQLDLEPVYFDLDRFDIRPDAESVLRANARTILDNEAQGRLTIEGHCDERGSDEYNLALGERRANVVKRYLVDLGVPGDRLSTVSFGETQPAAAGHSESAWRLNRRSEFRMDRDLSQLSYR